MKTAAVHRYHDDPTAPGTCTICHLPDRADAPRNRHHDLEAVAKAEADLAARAASHQRRYGND